MEYRAHEIADTIIASSRKRGIADLTNLKLQKLLYYSQAWHLALTDRILFSEDVEAWIHGPVVPRVFGLFKDFRWNVIDCKVHSLEDDTVIGHIDSVLEKYGEYGATQLERLTHSEAPWIYARRGLAPDEPSRNVISTDHMKNFYRSLMIHA
jgi:uncharacterized phage-associated protein